MCIYIYAYHHKVYSILYIYIYTYIYIYIYIYITNTYNILQYHVPSKYQSIPWCFLGGTRRNAISRRAAAVVASVQERGVILCGIEGVDLDEQGSEGAKG